jgi:hypothetical protein
MAREPITGIAFCCARRARAAVIAPPSRSISSRRLNFLARADAGQKSRSGDLP